MTPNLRKFALLMHISTSVGWIGAVASFVALAITGLVSQNDQMVRASYLTMDLITWFAIVPFALASLFTGIVSSLSTKWGLLRHYWILLKLLVTIACITILLVHTHPIGVLAGAAATMTVPGVDLKGLRILMVVASGISLPVLLFLTALSVYKLRGITPFGAPEQSGPGKVTDSGTGLGTPQWVKVLGLSAIVMVVAFIILHLTGNSPGGHAAGG